MDRIREGIVQFVDKASFLVQNTFQTFGFLPDGRELVEVSETEGGLTVAFSDRSNEGWPGFSLNIPGEAALSHAMIGFLSRSAFWTVLLSSRAVVDHLSNRNTDFPAPGRGPEGRWTFSLNDQLKVRAGRTRDGVTLLWVTQTRAADSIGDAIRARQASFKERWG